MYEGFLRKWGWLVAVIGSVLGFLALSSEVQEAAFGGTELITSLDQQVFQWLSQFRSLNLNGMAIEMTALGSVVDLITIITFVTVFLLIMKKRFLALFLVLTSLGATVMTKLFKGFFQIARPDLALRLINVDGYSFPSGHALGSTVVYLTLAIVLIQFLARTNRKFIMFFLFTILIFVIAVTRIFLGVHNFSDVTAGILMGTAWVITANQFRLWLVRSGKKF